MRRANGTLPVHAVAAGYTVKDVSALIRFEQVRDWLWRNAATSLASLAHELGYADQSHLGHESKRYSTIIPAAFARQVKHVQRLVDRDFIAFVLT
jgi:AraC-like DNA-binding protein